VIDRIESDPETFLATLGEVFATFGPRTQDSGNVSYGVRVAGQGYFVKTAGRVDDPIPPLDHAARVALLRTAIDIARSCPHRACPTLHHVIESPAGPLLVYEWFTGELVGISSERRSDPASPYARFRALPAAQLAAALDTIYDLHAALAGAGWIAVDFYDGCLMYDFATSELRVIDLDMYRRGPFINTMGRMFGSTRFMAPEEFTLGAPIDERTTVFNLGRAAFVALGEPDAFRGSPAQLAVATRACDPDSARRFDSVAELRSAWLDAAR
jgi:serine/threonine-protein kinase